GPAEAVDLWQELLSRHRRGRAEDLRGAYDLAIGVKNRRYHSPKPADKLVVILAVVRASRMTVQRRRGDCEPAHSHKGIDNPRIGSLGKKLFDTLLPARLFLRLVWGRRRLGRGRTAANDLIDLGACGRVIPAVLL